MPELGEGAAVGLVTSLVGVVLLFVALATVVTRIPPPVQQRLLSAGNKEAQREAMQEMSREMMQLVEDNPRLALGLLGGMVLLVVGFVLSLLGVVLPGPRKRGWAYAGTAVGGLLLFLCLCSGIMGRL